MIVSFFSLFLFLILALLRMMTASYLRDDWWWWRWWSIGWVLWVGGESLQVESRWVCTVRAPPLTTFVKSITRTTPEHSNDAGRLPLKRLYSFWTRQINYYPRYETNPTKFQCHLQKNNKKDQRISHSAGGVKSRVNLLNSIPTLVNFKDEFPLLILAAFSTAAAALTLTRLTTSTKHFC